MEFDIGFLPNLVDQLQNQSNVSNLPFIWWTHTYRKNRRTPTKAGKKKKKILPIDPNKKKNTDPIFPDIAFRWRMTPENAP